MKFEAKSTFFVLTVDVSQDTTTVRMFSEYPGDDNVSDVSRRYFHETKPVSLHVASTIDKHPGIHSPRRMLAWMVTWDHSKVKPPVLTKPTERFAVWSKN